MTSPNSEHWYRVASLRPQLRSELDRFTHRYRGLEWVVLRDPVSDRFVRVRAEAWDFLRRLDGSCTVEASLDATRAVVGDDFARSDAVELLSWLHREGLLRSDERGDHRAKSALRSDLLRGRRGQRPQHWLTPRLHLFDPDHWLDRVAPTADAWLGVRTLGLWIALLMLAALALAGEGENLRIAGEQALDPDIGTVVVLALCFVAIKVVHEFAHGIACKVFARREGVRAPVRSMGVLWIALLPVAFCDASSAWALSNKWHRVGVSLAGIAAESVLAALAALLWVSTGEGIIHTLAFQCMLVCGVSTLAINGNPLLRFDGYFALADAAELPNLAERSRSGWLWWLRTRWLGARDDRPPWDSPAERHWLLGYGIAATLFRWFVLFWLLYYLSGRAFFVGAAFAALGAWVWIVRPLLRAVGYLAESPELAGRRVPALRTAALGALALTALVAIPVPERVVLDGVAEPATIARVYPEETGRLLHVQRRAAVAPGGLPLVTLASPELEARLRIVRAELAGVRIRLRESVGRSPAQVQALREDAQVLEQRLIRFEERRAALEIRAPFRGTWIPARIDGLEGSTIAADPQRPLGLVADLDRWVIRVVADQELGPRMATAIAAGDPVAMRMYGGEGCVSGRIQRIVPGGQHDLPAAVLRSAAGAVASGRDVPEAFFEIRVVADDPLVGVRIGERASVRFELGSSPLALRGWRALSQLLQRRSAG